MQYKLRTPVTREDLAPLRTGDTVLLSGAVYTARDAAHKRMMELLDFSVDALVFQERERAPAIHTDGLTEREAEALARLVDAMKARE